MPMYPGSQWVLIKKCCLKICVIRRLDENFVEIKRSRGEVEKAGKTRFRVVFFPVEVVLKTVGGTMCHRFMVVKYMVNLLQGNDLKYEHRQ